MRRARAGGPMEGSTSLGEGGRGYAGIGVSREMAARWGVALRLWMGAAVDAHFSQRAFGSSWAELRDGSYHCGGGKGGVDVTYPAKCRLALSIKLLPHRRYL